MDFNSLSVGSPFYVLTKSDRPRLTVGVVKDKSAAMPKYQPQAVPGAFNGMQTQMTVAITATVDGKDEVYSDVPVNVEIAQRGNEVITGTREAMLQHVDGMIQSSRKALEMVDAHKAVIEEGEKMLETLNPRYAEEKKQARTIEALEERQQATDDKIAEMLALLKKLSDNNK